MDTDARSGNDELPTLTELVAADNATRAAAASVDRWIDLYRRAAGEALSEPSLDSLLREALEAIGRLLDADAVSLLLANEDATELVSRAAFGLALEVDLSVSIPAGAGLSGPILATGEPRIVEDLTRTEVISQVLRESGQRSYVGVPLAAAGRTVGVLHATRSRVAGFESKDVELLMRFADPLAMAIERVRLFEAERSSRHAAEQANDRLGALQEITSALVSAATVDEVCATIIREVARVSSEEGNHAIWVLRQGRLVLVAGAGRALQFPEVPLEDSLPAASALRDGSSLFVESNAELSERWPALAETGVAAFAGLPLVANGESLGILAIGFSEDHVFDPVEREFVTAIAEQAAAALAQAQSREALHEARVEADARRAQLDYLATASDQLNRSLDLDVTLRTVARLSVPRLTDRCALYLLKGDTFSKQMLSADLSIDEQELFEETDATLSAPYGVGAVIRTGEPLYYRDVDEETMTSWAGTPERLNLIHSVGFGGLLILPLRARGRTIGALSFANRTGRPLEPDDRALAQELAARAAIAIDNAMLYSRESFVAHRLAEALLPTVLPSIEGLDIGVRYEPASSGLGIGGDFYDIWLTDDEKALVVIGDVQGKGVEAAALTGLVSHSARACAQFETHPGALLCCLNRELVRNVINRAADKEHPWDSARLCTAAVLSFERRASGWLATVSSAGHPLPLLRKKDGSVTSMGRPALLLGTDHDVHYSDSTEELEFGSTVLLYTDGIGGRYTDPQITSGELVAELLRTAAGPASEVADRIAESALLRRAAGQVADDLVVIAIRLEAPA